MLTGTQVDRFDDTKTLRDEHNVQVESFSKNCTYCSSDYVLYWLVARGCVRQCRCEFCGGAIDIPVRTATVLARHDTLRFEQPYLSIQDFDKQLQREHISDRQPLDQ